MDIFLRFHPENRLLELHDSSFDSQREFREILAWPYTTISPFLKTTSGAI